MRYFSEIRYVISVSIVLVSLALFPCAISASADFNGDGKDDIVWRTHAGSPLIWQMDGTQLTDTHELALQLDAASAILAPGTFFSDGRSGLLWVNSNGQLFIWRIGDNQLRQTCTVEHNLDADWHYLATGDINGDGIDDVIGLLPNGTIKAYIIDGCNLTTSLVLDKLADPTLTFAGAGDIDGDGFCDLLWRKPDGDLLIWHIHANGSTTASIETTGALSQSVIVALADLNGDGTSDIVWRSPGESNVVAWLMQGSGHLQESLTQTPGSNPFDEVFHDGFDGTSSGTGYSTPSAWRIVGSGDFDGDYNHDLLLANRDGRTAVWLMQGTTIITSAIKEPGVGMPWSELTGWRLPMARPTVTKSNGEVDIRWSVLPHIAGYTLFASSQNMPEQTGTAIPVFGTSFSFTSGAPNFENKRYFAITAGYQGIQLPPSRQAYTVEYAKTDLSYFGATTVADINQDGCTDILGSLGDCQGNFQRFSEADMGMGSLRSPGRAYRDIRFADLNGDGIDDAIANVYSSITDTASQSKMFIGLGGGQFVEDSTFANLAIGGFGETIVIADFDNDGDLDIFLPNYSFNSPDEHCWLLVNDGLGHFTDIADSAGVANRNSPAGYRVEGAQAVDINDDAWIDLYVGSHLFINNGNLTFTNVGPVIDLSGTITAPSIWGLPAQFDEGAKFIDFDNSGQLSLALNTVISPPGLRIFRFDGMAHFYEVSNFTNPFMRYSYGMNAADADGDGLTDLVVGGGCDESYYDNGGTGFCGNAGDPHALPQLFVNRNGIFVEHDFYEDGLLPAQRGWSDLLTFADFDHNGTVDWVARVGRLAILIGKADNPDTISVTAVGRDGQHNQAGRVVRVQPLARPNTIMTQVVDGGSGYMSNGPYSLTFAAPYPGEYLVTVRFASGTFSTVATSGDRLRIFADGHTTLR